MGVFTKIMMAICVVLIAVKWTAPRFDEGKCVYTKIINIHKCTCKTVRMTYPYSAVDHLLDCCVKLVWEFWRSYAYKNTTGFQTNKAYCKSSLNQEILTNVLLFLVCAPVMSASHGFKRNMKIPYWSFHAENNENNLKLMNLSCCKHINQIGLFFLWKQYRCL